MMLLGQGGGKWVVQYADGQRSEPMHKKTALKYMRMFDGEYIEKVVGRRKRKIYRKTSGRRT